MRRGIGECVQADFFDLPLIEHLSGYLGISSIMIEDILLRRMRLRTLEKSWSFAFVVSRRWIFGLTPPALAAWVYDSSRTESSSVLTYSRAGGLLIEILSVTVISTGRSWAFLSSFHGLIVRI